ncbi:MAG: outer membrane protein assembly factor BamD [Candidatus Omnitrophica bacterium]|nr:outer membrane protein assembly factor BamD [Candidatus Omnitrophota bacterium]
MQTRNPSHRIILAIVLVSFIAAPSAFAAWVWSPQTGWVGPGGAVKDSPQEQLVFAVAFFDRKDYEKARGEFKKLLRAYKDSPEAAEAQYYMGRCEEESGDYYKAFLEYRKTVQTYPSTKRFEEILEREYQIGNYFLGGKKRKLFGTAAILPARDKAVEIFQAIVDDGPFSEYGELAQYKLGLTHLALQDYELAVGAFEQVVSRYPESPLVDDARFQIAQASLKGTFRPGYDQSPTDLAIRELDSFLREYPESELADEAKVRLEELKERRAQHEYQVGQFYERRKQPASALLYYQNIAQAYPKTSLAGRAAERVQVLSQRP